MNSHLRLCAGDIGSNAIKVRMVEVANGDFRTVCEKRYPVRLGASVFESRRMSAEAIEATVEVFREVAGRCRELKVDRVRIVATSATREAVNGNEMTETVRRETGVRIDVISGEEEARLLALGVRPEMAPDRSNLVIDVGGGSTEVIWTDPSLEIRSIHSLLLGAVRLAQLSESGAGWRHGKKAFEQLRRNIRSALADASLPAVEGKPHVTGVAGTARALLGAKYRSGRLPGEPVVYAGELTEMMNEMGQLEPERIAKRFGLDVRRAQVIVPGGLIVAGILEHYGLESVTVSCRGLREGVLQELMGEEAPDVPAGRR